MTDNTNTNTNTNSVNTEWPADERPREKLLLRGPSALSDVELLAIFLGSGLRGQNATTTATNILAEAGGLRSLMEMPLDAMATIAGIGMARATLLHASLELGNRYLHSELVRSDVLRNPAMAGRYFKQRLRSNQRQVFAVLFLDTRHRPIMFEEMFQGTVGGTEVHAREIVRRALQLNATAVMVGHNNPSGARDPDLTDRAQAKKIKAALEIVDLRLLDYFIVGDGDPVSLANMGWC